MNDTVATEDQEHPARGHERKARKPDRDPGRRTSSGPADICSASTGRTYDRSRPNRSKRQKVLATGPSTYAPQGEGGRLRGLRRSERRVVLWLRSTCDSFISSGRAFLGP